MKSTFVGQRINFLGPVTLVVGKRTIAGEALMCGTLYVEVAAPASFSAVSASTAFRPSDISGNFTPGDPKALSAIKSGEAEIVWKNRGKETTLPVSVTEVRMTSVKFVARKPYVRRRQKDVRVRGPGSGVSLSMGRRVRWVH